MSRDVRANPTNRAGKYVETGEYVKFVRRVARSMGKRVADMDPEALAELSALVDELRDVEVATARALNDQGYSWADIGRAQGIVGNAAWKRYAKASPHAGSRSRPGPAPVAAG